MKISFIKRKGVLIPYSEKDRELVDNFKDDAIYESDIKNMDTRTLKQNSSMHKYFDLVSRELNKRGHKIESNIGLSLEWNKDRVKELIWREFQKVVLGKESTKQLDKKEITEIYDHMNLYLGERYSFNIEFPSMENKENK